MARCKHLNCWIIGQILLQEQWHVDDGVIDGDGYVTDGSPSHTVRVKCEDCGMGRQYSKYNAPKWLHNLMVDAQIIFMDTK